MTEDGRIGSPASASSQPARAGRRRRRDGRVARGPGGAPRGTDGAALWRRRLDARDLRGGWLAIAAVGLTVMAVNSLTSLADFPDVRPWEPWLWEGTSLGALLLLAPIPWLATAAAPPEQALAEGWRSKAAFAAVHLGGLLLYSGLHVSGFVLLRKLAYATLDHAPYVFGDRFIYELRKDALGYALFVGVFWLAGYIRRRRDEPVRPVSFDIRDGARIIRAPLDQIVAVSSAGNYVEFWLADGRRPLMRATLAAVEAELERFGFVRAHRSWLVNAARVTGLRPDGSGDWTVELGTIEAPLSRRYPGALERLRA